MDKAIYVIAKIFDQQGCIAYRCKTINEARCLPGTLQALCEEGVQIVILDEPEIYSEYAPLNKNGQLSVFEKRCCHKRTYIIYSEITDRILMFQKTVADL